MRSSAFLVNGNVNEYSIRCLKLNTYIEFRYLSYLSRIEHLSVYFFELRADLAIIVVVVVLKASFG